MQRIVRIDFRQLLLDLAAAGMSPVDVAAELTHMLGERVAPSTPYRWLDGSTPLHPHGAALLILHGRVMAAPAIRHGEKKSAQHGLPCAVPMAVGQVSEAQIVETAGRVREEGSVRLASIKARNFSRRK